jgi:hypothetical protein
MDYFEPHAQYGDWAGKCMADNADGNADIWGLLSSRGLMRDDEFLIGVRSYNAENQVGQELASVFVTALLVPAKKNEDARRYVAETEPLRVRTVEVELSVSEFARLFKRFSIVLANRGFDIIGASYESEGSD